MLKTRIIPTLLWKDHGLVKGVGFDSKRRVGTALPAVKVYNLREVDEIILVDIKASAEDREPDYDEIAEFTQESFVPMTIGGGISRVEHIRSLLLAGADKVAINSAAYGDPDLVARAATRFGTQCIVASIDYRRLPDGRTECFSHAGQRSTGLDPVVWAREMAARGAGEILLTSIDRDGAMAGYDLDMIRRVSGVVNIPVIASGGAGSCDDVLQAVKAGGAAVAAASIFHFTEITPLSIKTHLAAHGVPIRRVV